MSNENELQLLRDLIEKSIGKKMVTPADFQFLATEITRRCHETLGITTLKRIWGYVDGYETVRNSTLSILARCVGFHDWQDFIAHNAMGGDSSQIIVGQSLVAEQLPENARLRVCWAPDRECVFIHTGNGNFVVAESRNSKLQAGDTFHCNYFIVGQPLYIDRLMRADVETKMFVAGAKGGLTTLQML